MAGRSGEPDWIALGVELALLAEGGRRTPVSLAEPLTYRPGWRLPTMTGTEQTGAAVLCGSPVSFRPGDRGRVVVVPPYPPLLDAWHRLAVGDVLATFEGPRLVGWATVRWSRRTPSFDDLRAAPPPDLRRWVEGGPEPA